jgi:hypothetical protein
LAYPPWSLTPVAKAPILQAVVPAKKRNAITVHQSSSPKRELLIRTYHRRPDEAHTATMLTAIRGFGLIMVMKPVKKTPPLWQDCRRHPKQVRNPSWTRGFRGEHKRRKLKTYEENNGVFWVGSLINEGQKAALPLRRDVFDDLQALHVDTLNNVPEMRDRSPTKFHCREADIAEGSLPALTSPHLLVALALKGHTFHYVPSSVISTPSNLGALGASGAQDVILLEM